MAIDYELKRTGAFYDAGGAHLNAKSPLFGAKGDGITDDTAALQAWLDAIIATGRPGFLPDGEYVHDGTPALTGGVTFATSRDHQIDFGPKAFLRPTAGYGLLLDGASRVVLNGPKVKLYYSSTATAGIRLSGSVWVTINNPVVWAYIDPSSFIAVDVDDDSYWCTVDGLTCERVEGSGLFDAAVQFRNQSNAGIVQRSAIAHFGDGVRVDGSNGVRVCNNSFEAGTYGVHTVPTTASGNIAGLVVSQNRFELVTKDVKVDAYLSPYDLQIANNYHATSDPIDNTAAASLAAVAYGVRIPDGEQVKFTATNDFLMGDDGGGGGSITAREYLTINSDHDANGSGDIRLAAGGSNKIIVGPAGVGFHGVAASARPTITGSRGGNAALADLLTKLAATGLITDSTSA